MAKDPAFLFYASDFLTGISDLDMEERGVYITLLCLQHQKGHLTEKMIRLCHGIVSADVMAKFRQDENGNFYNERLDVEIEKRAQHSLKQQKRALDGWKKRKSNNDGNATAYTTANAMALPLENRNENVNEIIIDNNKGIVKGKKSKEFVAPTLEEFKNYFNENGFTSELGERAWKGYDAAGWKDSNGNPVKNWKQKCQHVWFSDSNKQHRIQNQTISQSKAQTIIQVHDLVGEMLKAEEGKNDD
jgi:uncharacterized protein YdaU (DUF1376 family)